jgi:hypothetical protein
MYSFNDWLMINKSHFTISFCKAHIFSNLIQIVTKCDIKWWALVTLHFHTSRKQGGHHWACKYCQCTGMFWWSLIYRGTWMFGYLVLLWVCWWMKLSMTRGWDVTILYAWHAPTRIVMATPEFILRCSWQYFTYITVFRCKHWRSEQNLMT